MPCFDSQAAGDNAQAREDVKRLSELLNIRTDMLCRVMKLVEAEEQRMDDSVFGHLPPDILQWWEAHKKWDELRNKVFR